MRMANFKLHADRNILDCLALICEANSRSGDVSLWSEGAVERRGLDLSPP
jgi:hypothetical protein